MLMLVTSGGRKACSGCIWEAAKEAYFYGSGNVLYTKMSLNTHGNELW
jgi:hypothetical protein